MKIVVDDKIPFIKGVIEKYGSITYLPGALITSDCVRDADALIIRTRTRCDEKLLKGSRVRFIATATIGYDHIDVDYLKKAGITWTNCPGCNASSVGQYIESSLYLLHQNNFIDLEQRPTLGIVGVGHVGTKVEERALKLGCRVLLCDPPRAEKEHGAFVSLEQIAKEADIITFHTPLTKEGRDATFHLCDSSFLSRCLHAPIIINSSRGAVVDNTALLKSLESGEIRQAIVDTWEHEPEINKALLQKVFIGTPHIAGYSADGKANATRMSLQALCRFFHLPEDFSIEPPSLPSDFLSSEEVMERALCYYNPMKDSERLKQDSSLFEWLRGNYPLRREQVRFFFI